jgi:hypothetical protein
MAKNLQMRVEPRAALVARNFDVIGISLHGATAASAAEKIMAHLADWTFQSLAKGLTRSSLLEIGAS